MNIKDGYALQLAIKKNYLVAIISGGNSEPAKNRLQGLGIQDIFLNSYDKLQVLKDYMYERELYPENVLYMGDDLPDYEVMQRVGLPVCPNNAVVEIKNISKYISPLNGGEGCVRDVIEKTMRIQNTWFLENIDSLSHDFKW